MIAVDTAAKLADAVARARAGTTILIADGRYVVSRPLHVRADRVSLDALKGKGEMSLGNAAFFSPLSFRVFGVLKVPVAADGRIALTARAWAVRGTAPAG